MREARRRGGGMKKGREQSGVAFFRWVHPSLYEVVSVRPSVGWSDGWSNGWSDGWSNGWTDGP